MRKTTRGSHPGTKREFRNNLSMSLKFNIMPTCIMMERNQYKAFLDSRRFQSHSGKRTARLPVCDSKYTSRKM